MQDEHQQQVANGAAEGHPNDGEEANQNGHGFVRLLIASSFVSILFDVIVIIAETFFPFNFGVVFLLLVVGTVWLILVKAISKLPQNK